MNPVSYILLGLLILCLAAAVVFIIRHRKKGGCAGCCGDCSQCGRKE